MATGDQELVHRLPKLNSPSEYIQWRRRLYAYLRRDDPLLEGLSEEPTTATATTRMNWLKKATRAKSNIILSLGDSALAQTRLFVDGDDKTAKDLWLELERIYATSNQQAIQNIKNTLDALQFLDGNDWNAHVTKFMTMVGELATYDEELSEKEKVSKLLRSLPNSFSPLAMVSHISSISLDGLINAVQAEISRRSNPFQLQPKVEDGQVQPKAHVNVSEFRSRDRRGRGRGIFNNRLRPTIRKTSDLSHITCFGCGKVGHKLESCWYRDQHQTLRRGRGRGRGRGLSLRRGRGFVRNSYKGPYIPTPLNDSSPPAPHPRTFGAPNYPSHQPSANFSFHQQQPGSSDNTNQGPPHYYQGWVSRRFRSKAARLSNEKSEHAIIDSGGTHHFFHRRSLFVEYETMDAEVVQAASSESRLVGKGKVWIPLHGGMIIEGYHAPEFSSHILSVPQLSTQFLIVFTNTIKPYNGCFIMLPRSHEVIWEAPLNDGLWTMDLSQVASKAKFAFANIAAGPRNNALHWHNKVGHPGPRRYQELSKMIPSVPHFGTSILQNIHCVPCLTAKAHQAPMTRSHLVVSKPLELIHLDISGPVKRSLNGNTYALSILDSMTAKSDVSFMSAKSQLFNAVVNYKNRVEKEFTHVGFKILGFRLDQAGENTTSQLLNLCKDQGIRLQYTPPYASESNGSAERLVQEHWTRTRVLLFASNMPHELWEEAMSHGNWLRNRLPSRRIEGRIPILSWSPRTKIDFSTLPEFGQPGFSFVYRSKTTANKKLLPRSIFGHFVGMESDESLYRIYNPTTKKTFTTRKADFKESKADLLPSVSVLLDGLARQHEAEASSAIDGDSEELLHQSLVCIHHETPHIAYSIKKKRKDFSVPSSFAKACEDPNWCDAIDREYNALVKRNTWTYIRRTPEMKPVPFTWVFKLKQIDGDGKRFLHKARCCLRGDKQTPFVDFNPDNTYAPVAAHETIRLLISYAASHNLILEGADISNAYLYGKMDIPILMEQPTNSTQVQERPGHLAILQMSLYGAKQAGELWGSLLNSTLMEWQFKPSNVDARLYFFRRGPSFVIMAIVVDDIAFASNSRELLEDFKVKLAAQFDIKLFGKLSSFIGWKVEQGPSGIKISQGAYARNLLDRHGMSHANVVHTPLPEDADFLPAYDGEPTLDHEGHSEYRSIIGGLIYLTSSTRPDLCFPVSVLARHLHAPTERHWTLLKRIMRYLIFTMQYGLHFPSKEWTESSLGASVDADWGGCYETRKSTTGFLLTVNGAPIHWRSRRQTVVALSSAESEYIALSSCAKDVSWMRRIFWEIAHQEVWHDHISFQGTVMDADSPAAMSLAQNPQVSARNKHIDLKIHHVRDLIKRGVVILNYVMSENQPADLLTKIMNRRTLARMVHLLKLNLVEDLM